MIKLILEGAVTEREPIYICRGWAKGADDIGDSYVEINLTDQHLYLYVDGELIWRQILYQGMLPMAILRLPVCLD